MIEDILLVPYIDLGNFPNDLHLQLNQTQDEQMDAEFDVDNPAPGKLATAIADHKAAVATENSAYIVSRSTPKGRLLPEGRKNHLIKRGQSRARSRSAERENGRTKSNPLDGGRPPPDGKS